MGSAWRERLKALIDEQEREEEGGIVARPKQAENLLIETYDKSK